jgi:hypothetical protein
MGRSVWEKINLLKVGQESASEYLPQEIEMETIVEHKRSKVFRKKTKLRRRRDATENRRTKEKYRVNLK